MAAANFNTANQTWRQLLGNGLTYVVPRFQRDYSWTEDEWDDLWEDIQGMLAPGGEPAHYMGYLVLQTSDNKRFEVIDGQQRLTTLSLLALAVLRALGDLAERGGAEAGKNRQRAETLRGAFIGFIDPVTLVAQPKLSLNRNNDAYYRDYIVPLQKLPTRGIRASEHLLRKAFEWFAARVHELPLAALGEDLARFLDTLADRLFFTVITVADELNAFKVFETLNARGVRLSPTDLLKNYLFSVVNRQPPHEQEIEALERRWNDMADRLGSESFPDFLRTHWNSRHRFVRESDLFKTMRSEAVDREAVFALLRAMTVDLDTYAALPKPEDQLWNPEQREAIRELRMFSVRQPWPLLLSAHRAYSGDEFSRLLRACSVVSFRYNVIGGLATYSQERVYNQLAQRIAAGNLARVGGTIRELAPIYVADGAFAEAFAEKTLRTAAPRNRNIARYVLGKIEEKLTGANYDLGSAEISLDHVLPENPGGQWPQFSEREFEDSVYRLGNYTLLESDLNRQAGACDFARKRELYAKSQFASTRRLASENDHWTVERIAGRQRSMAEQAKTIWRIEALA